jgi:hypothetical protein
LRDGDRIVAFGVGFALMAVLGMGSQAVGTAVAAGSPAQGYIPSDDAVALEAGGAYLIDVLANDAGLPVGAGDRLLILVNPACGVAARLNGKISYTLGEDCRGAQVLSYCVPSGDACPAATLTITVMPAPGTETDPVLSAGAPTRTFARDGATPAMLPDMGGGFFGVGALAPVGAIGADAPRRIPSVAATRPAPVLRPGPGRPVAEIDDATPSFSAIAAVSAPTDRKKPVRKLRSVYASPDLATPSIARPRRGADAGVVVGAPKTDAVAAQGLKTAPPARVQLAGAARTSPGLPSLDDASPVAVTTGPQPRLSVMGLLALGSLADRDGGVPAAPFVSPLAEFREIVTLAAAPEPDWSLPAPGNLARVAALSFDASGWAVGTLRDDPPAALPLESLEPLTGIAASITPINAPESFYQIVSLDPHSRHLRPTDPVAADAPRSGDRPADQAEERSEPLPGPLVRLTGEVAVLVDAKTAIDSYTNAAAPQTAAPQSAARHVAAANPLPFPEREDPMAVQVAELTEPLPPLLTRADTIPPALPPAVLRDAQPEGTAFRASLLAAPMGMMAPAQADRARVASPVQEGAEPLPPTLADWRALAADMPPMRVSVNQTISGARNMPGQSRRNFQVLSGEGAQPLRLVLLDQRPLDLDRAERTEPLPVNLRRLRTFPPLLSQRVRLTPDFYGVPRMGFRVRRYEELASLGIASHPATVFEREMAPRHVAADANPPSPDDARFAALTEGLSPSIAMAPTVSRRPFETAPAPSAPFWPETGLQPPLRGTPADGADVARADAAVQLASLDPTEGSAAAVQSDPAASALAAEALAPVDCALDFSAFPASGGMMQLEATSPCRAGRVAVLHMDDLRIALRFDAEGGISANVPGAGRDLLLDLVTSDGISASVSLTLLDAATVERVALIWDGQADLNLHAFEFGATPGGGGHVWAGGAPDARGYRRGSTGLVSSFPALDGLGQSVEFYSFNPGRRSPVGRIVMAVEFASRGPVPQAPYCGGDPLASPSFRILRFNRGVADRGVARLFEAAACDAALTESAIYLRDLVQDILVVGR